MLDVAIKPKEAETARRKLCRRPPPSETAAPEALVVLARLLARQAAAETMQNPPCSVLPGYEASAYELTVPAPDWVPRRLMSVPEVAKLLHQSDRQVWRDIAAGKLSVVRLGGSTRVTPEAVAARLKNADEQCQAATANC